MYADITIKARCADLAEAENILLQHNAAYKGLDVQTDTYYETETGKLKHRQGNIEHVLIHYHREGNQAGQKTQVMLYLKNPGQATLDQVCGGLNVLAEVKKYRKIFFIDNVKFHLDRLEGLGHFVEIEAIDLEGALGSETLRQQCMYYKELLQIQDHDLITSSYLDM